MADNICSESRRNRITVQNGNTKTWLVTLVTVLLPIILISIVIHELILLYQPTNNTEDVIMCISTLTLGNIKLNHTSQLKHDLRNLTEDGVVKYCGKPSNVIKWTNQMVLNDMYNDVKHPEFPFYTELLHESCVATNRTALILNLTEIDMGRTKEQNGEQSRLYWKQSSPASPELLYSNRKDSVVIKHAGMYRVTSHLMFNLDLENPRVKQNLHVRRNGTDVIILEYVDEACDTGEQSGNKPDLLITSEMSSVFEFKDGDHLFLTTSHTGRLVERRSTIDHFFIIFKLDV